MRHGGGGGGGHEGQAVSLAVRCLRKFRRTPHTCAATHGTIDRKVGDSIGISAWVKNPAEKPLDLCLEDLQQNKGGAKFRWFSKIENIMTQDMHFYVNCLSLFIMTVPPYKICKWF